MRATPLQMALVVAAVANDGVIMKPHVMKQIRTCSWIDVAHVLARSVAHRGLPRRSGHAP